MRNLIYSYYDRIQNIIELLECLDYANTQNFEYIQCPINPILDNYNFKTHPDLFFDTLYQIINSTLNDLDHDLGHHN